MARPKKQSNEALTGMEGALAMQSTAAEIPAADSSYDADPIPTTEATVEIDPVTPVPVTLPEPIDTVETSDSYENLSEPVFTEDETRAMQSGWTPKEIFKGDPDKWRDAKAWNDRNNIHSVIDEQKREISEMRRKQDELLQILREDRARIAATQLANVEKERDEAIRNGEIEKVKKLDDVVFGLRSVAGNAQITPAATPSVPVQSIPAKEITDFVERNASWAKGTSTDEVSIRKRSYALSLGGELDRTKPGMSLAEKMTYIEKEVNQLFDKQVKNVAPVEMRRTSMAANTSPTGLPSYDAVEPEARRIIESFLGKAEVNARRNKKQFSRSEFRTNYVKDLIKDGTIGRDGKFVQRGGR